MDPPGLLQVVLITWFLLDEVSLLRFIFHSLPQDGSGLVRARFGRGSGNLCLRTFFSLLLVFTLFGPLVVRAWFGRGSGVVRGRAVFACFPTSGDVPKVGTVCFPTFGNVPAVGTFLAISGCLHLRFPHVFLFISTFHSIFCFFFMDRARRTKMEHTLRTNLLKRFDRLIEIESQRIQQTKSKPIFHTVDAPVTPACLQPCQASLQRDSG